VKGSSNREFGLVMAGALAIVGLWPLWKGSSVRPWPLAAAAIFAILALALPSLLTPLNRLWMALGLLLGRITTPIFLGLLFFLVFTPVAILFRIMGRDALRLRWNRGAPSYWIERTPPGPKPETMIRQF
jgi:hypothetical protein